MLAVLVVVLLLLLAPPAAAVTESSCAGDPGKVRRLDITVEGQPAYGHYTAPRLPPLTLVVFAHGFTVNVTGWGPHLRRTARREGALAVAMNYRGLIDIPDSPADKDTYQSSRGYPVEAGSLDLAEAARHFLAICPSLRRVVLYGPSLGGNVSGITMARQPRRQDGSPLFDYWIGIEGAYDLVQLYQGARLLAPVNEFAAKATADIEKETGGPFESRPNEYFERSPVHRADDIAASGAKGVVLVHGIEDGATPYHFGTELSTLLRARGMPTDFYTVGSRRPDDDSDTTFGSYLGIYTGNAGHGSESSQNHIVIDTGFDRLTGLITRNEPPPCNRDFQVEGRSGTATTSPNPSLRQPGCPAGTALGLCRDSSAPTTTLKLRATRRRLTLRGRARDRACRAPWKVERVRVSIRQRVGHGSCRFLRRSGRLSRRRACSRPLFIRAKGTRRWKLSLPRRFPAGRYRFTAIARDPDGNRSRPLRRTRRVS